MKRYFCIATLLFLTLTSCTEKELSEEILTDDTILSAVLPSTDSSTNSKVSIRIDGEDAQLYWSEGDSFTAYDENCDAARYDIISGDYGKNKAQFQTSAPDFKPVKAFFPSWFQQKYSEVYPLSVVLPETYGNGLRSQNIPMLGEIGNHQVRFSHLAGLLRIDFKALPEGFNAILIHTDRPITGTFKIRESTEEKGYVLLPDENFNDHKNEITVKEATDGICYFPLPVGTYNEIVVTATDGKREYNIFNTSDKVIHRGFLYNVERSFLLNPAESDYQTILYRLKEANKTSPKKEVVDGILAVYKTEPTPGMFKDLKYNAKDYLQHLERLEIMTKAYIDDTKPDNVFLGDEELYNKIVGCLKFWIKKPRHYKSWFENWIKQPNLLGVIMTNMRFGAKTLPPDLEASAIQYMEGCGGHPYDKDGSNRTGIAKHWIMRGCLKEDPEVLSIALNSTAGTICYTTGDGLQHDGSFFHHGRQLYIGGYGASFLGEVASLAALTYGTAFQLSQDKIDIIHRYLTETYFPTIRSKYISYNVLGRTMTRRRSVDRSYSYTITENMSKADPARKNEYDHISDRIKGQVSCSDIKSFHTHFYHGDYTLHVRPEYTVDVRMTSKFTSRAENGDNENIKGYFLSDGGTGIQVSGNEYFDIFPVWNWYELPGITAPQLDIPYVEYPSFGKTVGTSSFSGGVSDDLYGASAYAYYDLNLLKTNLDIGANKSWFFFDDEIVCLGQLSPKVKTEGRKVYTTVNQCLRRKESPSIKYGPDNVPQWVYHQKIGYVFPQGGDIWVTDGTQEGNWEDINADMSGHESKEVFKLGFDHSIHNQRGYAYILVPGISNRQILDGYLDPSKSPLRIVSNELSVQSVYHKQLQIWQTVFFDNSKTLALDEWGLELEVDNPCIVMLEAKGSNYEVYVADPSRRLSSINLTITSSGRNRNINVPLNNTDVYGGKTEKMIFTL